MAYEWMIAGSALAYAIAIAFSFWLFAEKPPSRVALPAFAFGSALYLCISLIQWAQQNTSVVRNFFLSLPQRTHLIYAMASEGFRNGAYSASTTIAAICVVILVWDRWARDRNSQVAFGLASGTMGVILAVNYLIPLFSPLIGTERSGITDLILPLADVVFFIWAFVLIARSEVIQRFFSPVPENKK